MWRLMLLISIVAPTVLYLHAAEAKQSPFQARIRPVGESHVRGWVEWDKPEEWYPMDVKLTGAEPYSTVELTVCGPSIDSSTGQVFDHCWPIFVNEARESAVEIDGSGRARLQMLPKTYAGPYLSLVTAERVEVHGEDQVLISVGLFGAHRPQ